MDVLDVDLTTEGDEEDDKKAEAQDKKVDEADMDELDELDELSMEADMDELDELDMDQAKDDREHGGDDAPASMGPGAEKDVQKRHTESLRRRLASEARLQLEAKKKAQQAKKQQSEAQKQAKQKMKEAQDQAKKGKKVQAQQNKKVAQKKAQEAKKMQEAYNFYARKFNESVARSGRLKGLLSEAARKGSTQNGASARSAAESSNLRNKLAETNLFNAKLLFTNKLLQNESLTKRQKAEVIERLDEARNEREVKLVYESLVKTLQGSPAKLTESADRGVIGSSSRPARQASATNSLNEGFEADRWARLAGIVK